MAKLTFAGGIYPYDGKKLTRDIPIQQVLPKGELIYPVVQHVGTPAKVLVKVGDRVLMGQKIAAAEGPLSASVHASVSGTVTAVEPRKTVGGKEVLSIVVSNDELYEAEGFYPVAPLGKLEREEILEIIQEAGVVGMGGVGYPTHVKLAACNPEKIDYVVANCAESEPYLTSDYRRMLEEPELVIGGLQVLLQMFPNAHGILAVEDSKPECISLFRQLTRKDTRIIVRGMKAKYPQGAERQLIYAVTGRQFDSSKLPSDVGCVVNNVDTLVAIYRAVNEGRPLMERIVTVSGDGIEVPRNFRVPIGTSFRTLIEEAGGFVGKPKKIICGGPMMGTAIEDSDVPVTKTATALLAFLKDKNVGEETACINCGRCAKACPSRLLPGRLADYAKREDEKRFLKCNGMECCSCGSCSYVCPAKRPLTGLIAVMRDTCRKEASKEGGNRDV